MVVKALATVAGLFLFACTALPKIAGSRENNRVRFGHAYHVKEQGLQCLDCHDRAEKSESAEDNNLPRAEICLNCHKKDDPKCGSYLQGAADAPVPGVYRGRNLLFSHKVHAQKRACLDCHSGIENATPGRRKDHIPAMNICLACHTGNIQDRCGFCHQDPRAPGFRPKSHDAFWRDMHGRATSQELSRCEVCHSDGWCQGCHQGTVKTRFHDSSFKHTHGLEARTAPGRCDRCHLSNFCRNCHASLPGSGIR